MSRPALPQPGQIPPTTRTPEVFVIVQTLRKRASGISELLLAYTGGGRVLISCISVVCMGGGGWGRVETAF